MQIKQTKIAQKTGDSRRPRKVSGRQLEHIREQEIIIFGGIGGCRIRVSLGVTGEILHLNLFDRCSETPGCVPCSTRLARQPGFIFGIGWTDETRSVTAGISLSTQRARFICIDEDPCVKISAHCDAGLARWTRRNEYSTWSRSVHNKTNHSISPENKIGKPKWWRVCIVQAILLLIVRKDK